LVILLIFFIASVRFSYRAFRFVRTKIFVFCRQEKKILLIGAGEAGNTIIREIRRNENFKRSRVVCAIDDDKRKMNSYISDVRVVGGADQIVRAVQKYNVNEIIFAIPSATAEQRKRYFSICKETSCTVRTLPSIYEMLNEKASISMLRPINISDLLGREQVETNMEEACEYIKGKIVLITGAAGSIGSELCRQVAKFEPKQLILLDIYENTTFFLENELRSMNPELNILALIGSVRDKVRLDYIFATYRPNVVYHAAAHKHVPLMEASSHEAIKNNVFGTLNTVEAAHANGVSRFVLISTDKAVNPTNIMGASKRICEMLIQTYNKHSSTEFVAVRFGNVLGSNGSVIPVFQKQIAAGGPVTVTHPDVIRYFMTISEAASLVIQAGTFAKGGEIFVLDMGAPVRIMDLAENMILLSGKIPHQDIKIQIVGLRPGEKVKEELLMDAEGLKKTSNKKIFIGMPIPIDEHEFFERLSELKRALWYEEACLRQIVHEIVPTYRSAETVNQKYHARGRKLTESSPMEVYAMSSVGQ
jgi:FlaA1/EpsC-like NDP-sugar epimerase